jgi:hypothetical protein
MVQEVMENSSVSATKRADAGPGVRGVTDPGGPAQTRKIGGYSSATTPTRSGRLPPDRIGPLLSDDVSGSLLNTDLARYFTPKITSIDPHGGEMARRTAEMIRDHLDGKNVRLCQYVIQPDLVVRGT